jgi:hypothetical protein
MAAADYSNTELNEPFIITLPHNTHTTSPEEADLITILCKDGSSTMERAKAERWAFFKEILHSGGVGSTTHIVDLSEHLSIITLEFIYYGIGFLFGPDPMIISYSNSSTVCHCKCVTINNDAVDSCFTCTCTGSCIKSPVYRGCLLRSGLSDLPLVELQHNDNFIIWGLAIMPFVDEHKKFLPYLWLANMAEIERTLKSSSPTVTVESVLKLFDWRLTSCDDCDDRNDCDDRDRGEWRWSQWVWSQWPWPRWFPKAFAYLIAEEQMLKTIKYLGIRDIISNTFMIPAMTTHSQPFLKEWLREINRFNTDVKFFPVEREKIKLILLANDPTISKIIANYRYGLVQIIGGCTLEELIQILSCKAVMVEIIDNIDKYFMELCNLPLHRFQMLYQNYPEIIPQTGTPLFHTLLKRSEDNNTVAKWIMCTVPHCLEFTSGVVCMPSIVDIH